MRNIFCTVALLGVIGLAGCSSYKDTSPGTEVDVNGTVTGPDGKPLTGVNIVFQPAEAGTRPESIPLKPDGTFTTKMLVGKYLYFVAPKGDSDARGEAIVNKLPESYRKADTNRSIEIGSSGKLTLKF